MQETAIKAYQERIETELKQLDDEDSSGADDRATVTLDQQSVGRLSRMDALQRQALAQATQRRRQIRRQRLNAALLRITEGEFGFCEDCGEEIAPARLNLDPTVSACIECAKAR